MMGKELSKETLVDDILSRVKPGGSFSDADLCGLYALFDQHTVLLTLEAALSKKSCVQITAKSGRKCFEYSFAGTTQLCFVSPVSYCTCDEFTETLLNAKEKTGIICKHVLAIKLALAARTLAVEKVSDVEFAARCMGDHFK